MLVKDKSRTCENLVKKSTRHFRRVEEEGGEQNDKLRAVLFLQKLTALASCVYGEDGQQRDDQG
jgi:hypothetical protein